MHIFRSFLGLNDKPARMVWNGPEASKNYEELNRLVTSLEYPINESTEKIHALQEAKGTAINDICSLLRDNPQDFSRAYKALVALSKPATHPKIRAVVASIIDPTFTAEGARIYQTLLKDPKIEVRAAALSNELAPARALEQYANNGNEKIDKAIAENRNTPVKVLRMYAAHANLRYRSFALNNPNTPNDAKVQILTDFAKIDDSEAQFIVAMHPLTPRTIRIPLLEKFAEEGNAFVTEQVVLNPETPEDIRKKALTRLCSSGEWDHQKFALTHRDTPQKPKLDLARNLMNSANVPKDVKITIAGLHIGTGMENIFEKLSKDPDVDVRMAVARNMYAGTRILDAMWTNEKEDEDVKKAAHFSSLAAGN